MTTSDKIAGPTDGNKQTELKKKEAIEKKKAEVAAKKAEEAAKKKAEDAAAAKIEKALKGSTVGTYNTTSDPSLTVTSNIKEIDWNKVQVIEDIKVILQKMDLKVRADSIQPDEPINRYLKD